MYKVSTDRHGNSETPPYVTAEPVVTHTELPSNLSDYQGKSFLVLATDGLWDRLNNDEVVGLVGAWLEGNRSTQSRKTLLSRVSHPDRPIAYSPHAPNPETEEKIQGYLFEDENLATHLIR